MVDTLKMIETLANSGLLERLNEQVKNEGLLNKQLLIDLVKDKKYQRSQGIGDDFIPDSGLYNAIGAIYPVLNRQDKDQVVRAHLSQFDKLNYIYVNINHTPHIREPLLLSDIVLARPIYWPGLKDEEHLWYEKKYFEDIKNEIITSNGLFYPGKVRSDFLVAYALLRSDITDFGEDYAAVANPNFLERVLKGIIAIRFCRSKDKESIEKDKERLYELLPESVHDKIETLRKQRDWAYAGNFE